MSRFSQKNEDSRGIRRGKIFRPFFLAAVFAAVIWGFWASGQRRMESIAMQGLFKDETKAFSAERKAEILLLLKSFKSDFGIPLEVNILSRPPAIGAGDPSRIHLDVAPSRGEAYLHLPPLVRRAVGEDFIQEMENSFSRGFSAGDWRENLVSVILALRAKLGEVTRQ